VDGWPAKSDGVQVAGGKKMTESQIRAAIRRAKLKVIEGREKPSNINNFIAEVRRNGLKMIQGGKK
jgi:hypothetical protein